MSICLIFITRMGKNDANWTKKQLAIELSKLKGFEEVSVKLEQYATPSEIAADWLWKAAFKGDIAGKVSVDAACGPGILGCGALLLGAKKVYFVDKDEKALEIAQKNVEVLERAYFIGKSEFSCCDISDFSVSDLVDTVLQNPPFGTKVKHHDKIFLEKAFTIGRVGYSMHKSTTAGFVEAMARDYHFRITEVWPYDFKLPMSLPWHKKRWHNVKVAVWRMEKQ